MTKTKAIGYVRVSRVGGRGGDAFLSPDLQRQSIERVCQREGFELVDVLEELDKSGGDADRPLWNQAIERVESGEAGRSWSGTLTASRTEPSQSSAGMGNQRRRLGSSSTAPVLAPS